MRKEPQDYSQARDSFLLERGWACAVCPRCQKPFFTKQRYPLNTCGSYRCEGGYVFLQRPAPKIKLTAAAAVDHFCFTEFVRAPTIDLVRRGERTLFASAAGQVHDACIYGGDITIAPQCSVLQPVVRLQCLHAIDEQDGFSSSFLNAGLAWWQASPEQHFQAFDKLLQYLSLHGICVGHLALKLDSAENVWGDLHVPTDSLKMNYGGLEIGIANFFNHIQTPNGESSFSDISLGVERFVWAANKNGSYFDDLAPVQYASEVKRSVLDAVRTATLLMASGLTPGSVHHGQKLRLILGQLRDIGFCLDWFGLVRYFHQFWRQFIELSRTEVECYEVLEQELMHLRNTRPN